MQKISKNIEQKLIEITRSEMTKFDLSTVEVRTGLDHNELPAVFIDIWFKGQYPAHSDFFDQCRKLDRKIRQPLIDAGEEDIFLYTDYHFDEDVLEAEQDVA